MWRSEADAAVVRVSQVWLHVSHLTAGSTSSLESLTSSHRWCRNRRHCHYHQLLYCCVGVAFAIHPGSLGWWCTLVGVDCGTRTHKSCLWRSAVVCSTEKYQTTAGLLLWLQCSCTWQSLVMMCYQPVGQPRIRDQPRGTVVAF